MKGRGSVSFPSPASYPTSPEHGQGIFKDGGLQVWDDDYDTWLFQGSGKAVPVFSAYRNAAYTGLSSNLPVVFDAEEGDPGSNFDTSNGRYTAPRAGWYHFDWCLQGEEPSSGTFDNGDWFYSLLKKNGTTFIKQGELWTTPDSNNFARSTGSATVYLVAGDYVEIIEQHNLGASQLTITAGAAWTWFAGFLVSNDYAGGVVTPKFRAYRTSNGAAIASVASAILFSTESYDHGDCYDPATGKYTAKVAGTYHFDAEVYGAGTYATTTDIHIRFYKNGAVYSFGQLRRGTGVADNDNLVFSDDIPLAAGDYVEVRVAISTGNFTAYGQAGGQLTRFSGHLIPEPAGVIVPESWHEVGAAGEPAYQGNFSAYSAGYEPAFRKDPFGMVHLKGLMKHTSTAMPEWSSHAFTLPVGYRPDQGSGWFGTGSCVTNASAYGVAATFVHADGRVALLKAITGAIGPSNGYLSLDGISFKAEG